MLAAASLLALGVGCAAFRNQGPARYTYGPDDSENQRSFPCRIEIGACLDVDHQWLDDGGTWRIPVVACDGG